MSSPIASPCQNCLKPSELCVCDKIQPLKTRIHVLILQHPQEPDKELGSARLAHLSLPNSTLRIGLSWPNLAKALGPAAAKPPVPSRWAVLYLGSGIKYDPKGGLDRPPGALTLVTKSGIPNPELKYSELDGLVVLDGTWSQAKALWWRNAWLLKLRRAILNPKQVSLYGNLRKEPRRECLSTIESIAEALVALGEPVKTGEKLKELFAALIQKQRAHKTKRA